MLLTVTFPHAFEFGFWQAWLYYIVLSMNEVDSMCKNVEYLADKLQAVRDCQGKQSQVCYMAITLI